MESNINFAFMIKRSDYDDKIEIGQKFGRLTVINRVEDYISPKGQHLFKYLCKCDCGNFAKVVGRNLRKEIKII